MTLDLGSQRIVVADPTMRQLFDLLRRLAVSELPVLVLGETGVGKESAARAVHQWSRRAAQPLVTFNCAAVQETLAESELFGYEKGAFTGATNTKLGLLEVASGGTVFLDEVGELSPGTQAKLLRALEARVITRLGDVRERTVDLRVVAATNRAIEDDVRAGRFRRDLYFRLAGATVVVPPLRERNAELVELAAAFLADACTQAGRAPLVLSAATLDVLRGWPWPGNVRELKNVMAFAAAAVAGDVVEPRHLPSRFTAAPPQPPVDPMVPVRATRRRFQPLAEEVRALERTRMEEALEAMSGNQSKAARALEMPRRTFVHKARKLGLTSKR